MSKQNKTSIPPDQPQRELILTELQRTLLVEAAAGTGKTTSMVGRMVALLREGHCNIENLAAVTFTRKAAAELRARFQVALEKAARESSGPAGKRLMEAVSQIERCFVGTIHSFCSRLLRERPMEAGVPLGFQEIEPDEDLRLRERAWSDYVAALFANSDPTLAELADLGLDINQLRDSFASFADFPDVDEWPAPAIELGDLAATVTELRAYLKHMQQLVPTFPVKRGNDELMSAYERVIRAERHSDLDRPAELLEVLALCKSGVKAVQKEWPGGKQQGKTEIDRWQTFATAHAEPLVQRWLEKRYAVVMRILHSAMDTYNALRTDLGCLNYQDLLMCAAALLRDKPAIRRYFRSRFTHLLVDEFQDTDPIQAQVVLLLTASDPAETDWRKCRPVPGSLFVVGDPKQSIYRFRRADIVTYNQVKQIIQQSDGQIIPLTANFRTMGPLLEWGNQIFDEQFPAAANAYSPAACAMQVGRSGDSPGELSGLKVLQIPGDQSNKDDAVEYEAGMLARYIHHAIQSGLRVPRGQKEQEAGIADRAQPGDFLIVTRQKKHLALYARKLQELGVPCQVTGGSALNEVSELPLLAKCLRALVEPENPVALVAILRGELFGFSDVDLYAFKRAKGRFSYRASVPVELADPVAARFRDAFERLKRYELWLKRLPPVPALERMAADLGVPMRACAGPGGDVQSGSMSKAFQLLRAAHAELSSVADLADHLDDLIARDAEFDGIPARPHDRPAVRLMNLHKVKGLEAPIVFLADPTGKWNPPVKLHVDRTGEQVRGYMIVHGPKTNFHAPVLAQPVDWEQLAAEEQRFIRAEEQRLMYVAATRAGVQLTITRKQIRNNTNHWDFFGPHLDVAQALVDPGPQAAVATPEVPVTDADVAAAGAALSAHWQVVEQPTYAKVAAKEISVTPSALHQPTSGEHGTEWGTVIHLLLQAAMQQPAVDLHELAYTALEDQQLDPALADAAVQMVQAVTQSEIWRRATASEQCLVEVPFSTCLPPDKTVDGLPTILRGVIDLAFREPAGWVIVDYKSDARPAEALPELTAHYAGQVRTYAETWKRIVGQPVHEAGLYFTHECVYVTL